MYNPYVHDPMFEYNIVFARFINRPETLSFVGYLREHSPRQLEDVLNFMHDQGSKVWGNAYVITTHGQKMPKTKYLTEQVLDHVNHLCVTGSFAQQTCSSTSRVLQKVDGIGSFLAGQVVADLKNTPGHVLYTAPDRDTFVVPGPGSLRGLGWFHYDGQKNVSPTAFESAFRLVRDYVDRHWPAEVPRVDNQDLQNCLCEFDKYCRVVTNTGRSKRGYNGR